MDRNICRKIIGRITVRNYLFCEILLLYQTRIFFTQYLIEALNFIQKKLYIVKTIKTQYPVALTSTAQK